ncbi:nuclear pore complex protein Nup50 [Cephus cinctus]|uniref:Nuclear pore complex protein Nup50 n=1 Tax=Cephus cinctus TaxID=211228 RepID=A0AAJ7BTT1_CEPCN|nr:nuclear pore complex protein Nup50 [Cephus cinctus]
MASKRSATSELNHDNWNHEDVPEEAGTFLKAADDILEKRVIKAARRRIPNSGDGATKSAFGAFTGFKTASTASSSSPFSFLANVKSSTTTNPVTNSNTTTNANTPNNGATTTTENGTQKLNTESAPTLSKTSVQSSTVSDTNKKQDEIFKKSSDYYAKLKGLNESVSQWIKTHVDSNPFCILSPIFRDYEKYLKEIEAKHGSDVSKNTLSAQGKKQESFNNDNTTAKQTSTSTPEKKSETSIFANSNTISASSSSGEWKPEKSIFGNMNSSKLIFGNAEQKSEGKSLFGNVSTDKNPFFNKSEEKKDDSSTKSDAKPTFSFGQSSSASTATAGFSFGSAKPFSFAAQVSKPQDSEEKPENEDKEEEDEPPKPDFKPVTEEGAVYEQRCKVFVKKESSFSDRGVGTLFLKPTPSGKTQLIVRAETSLGNLLLNTLLTASIPIQRMNKNTVMLACLPMPDSQPPPTPILLRVKTEEDADLLLETLNKHKK